MALARGLPNRRHGNPGRHRKMEGANGAKVVGASRHTRPALGGMDGFLGQENSDEKERDITA
ncbi:hypothetical protein E4U31_000604 [Claviceps sp. LM219 group G6]|nr:hypothetical protein E4U31_000604 [Claviceps sp. LM219 group G6]